MIRASFIGLLLAGVATTAVAQDPHAGHAMPAAADPHAGHSMPAKPSGPQEKAAPPSAAAEAAPPAAPHAGHDMTPPRPPADPHAGHHMGARPAGAAAQLPVGAAPAPSPIADNLADGFFASAAMTRARDVLAREHGGDRPSKLQADILEWAPDGDAYGWEVEGWWGGDINRLAFRAEGEGRKGEGLEAAEVQLLYSRALTRYTDLQAGLRYDLEPRSRAYAVVSADTMLPYWFEVEGALFLSDKGDLLARVEGSYDLRLTQRLILQPRAEVDLAAQDIAESGTGSGLSVMEAGLRLRYEIRREFAPYIGVTYERAFGETARFRRAAGEDRQTTRFVVGLRAWF